MYVIRGLEVGRVQPAGVAQRRLIGLATAQLAVGVIKPTFHEHVGGASAGGPIAENRAFYFASAEYTAVTTANTYTSVWYIAFDSAGAGVQVQPSVRRRRSSMDRWSYARCTRRS